MTVKDDAPFKRHQLVAHLEANRIQTRSYFAGNILAHPGYQELAAEYDNIRETFPVASYVTLNSFFLGTFIGLTEEKLDYIQQVVDDFFKDMKWSWFM